MTSYRYSTCMFILSSFCHSFHNQITLECVSRIIYDHIHNITMHIQHVDPDTMGWIHLNVLWHVCIVEMQDNITSSNCQSHLVQQHVSIIKPVILIITSSPSPYIQSSSHTNMMLYTRLTYSYLMLHLCFLSIVYLVFTKAVTVTWGEIKTMCLSEFFDKPLIQVCVRWCKRILPTSLNRFYHMSLF